MFVQSSVASVMWLAMMAGGVDGTAGDPLIESFEFGLGAWSIDHYLEQFPPCKPDCTLDFTIEPTTEQAHDGLISLEFTGVGHFDDGDFWIERPIELTPGTWTIELEFQLWAPSDADVGIWEVDAFIGMFNPEFETDFTQVGVTGTMGWSPYSLTQTMTVDEPTTAYVALGVNIVFEATQTYFIDSVSINGIPPQRPAIPADLNGDGSVGPADLALLLGAWGRCGDVAKCPEDLDRDGIVGPADLALLLGTWGPIG